MAQFRGTIQGNRGEASRLGTKSSGMYAEINGWNKGIRVTASHKDGKDYFWVQETGRSNRNNTLKFIAEIFE